MKTVLESFLAMACMILWIVVLPVAGIFEAGVAISDAFKGWSSDTKLGAR